MNQLWRLFIKPMAVAQVAMTLAIATAYLVSQRLPSSSETAAFMVAWCLGVAIVATLSARHRSYLVVASGWAALPIVEMFVIRLQPFAVLPIVTRLLWSVGLAAAVLLGYALSLLRRRTGEARC
jgi:hypothetical protein